MLLSSVQIHNCGIILASYVCNLSTKHHVVQTNQLVSRLIKTLDKPGQRVKFNAFNNVLLSLQNNRSEVKW